MKYCILYVLTNVDKRSSQANLYIVIDIVVYSNV